MHLHCIACYIEDQLAHHRPIPYNAQCKVHALFYCSPSLLPIPIPFACFRGADAKYWLYSSTPLAQEVYKPPTHALFSWSLALCTIWYVPCIMHHIDVLPCLDLNWTCICSMQCTRYEFKFAKCNSSIHSAMHAIKAILNTGNMCGRMVIKAISNTSKYNIRDIYSVSISVNHG